MKRTWRALKDYGLPGVWVDLPFWLLVLLVFVGLVFFWRWVLHWLLAD